MAGSYLVTNTNDSGAGSLRQAILDLNTAGDAANTITFTTSGNITLASALDNLTKDVTLVNASTVRVTLDAAANTFEGLFMDGSGGGTAINGVLPDMNIIGDNDIVAAGGDPSVAFTSDISGTVRVETRGSSAYGVANDVLNVTDISGTVTAVAGGFSAFALYGNTSINAAGALSGTLTATARADAETISGAAITINGDVSGAIGAYTTVGDTAIGINTATLVVGGDISGTITATAADDDADGLFASDADLQNLSGTITVNAGDNNALGIYADTSLLIRGDVSGTVSATTGGDNAEGISAFNTDIQNVSGSIIADSGGNEAFGIYTGSTLFIRGALSGSVSATAAGYTAMGLYNDGGALNGGTAATPLNISGSVSTSANGLSVGVTAWGAMNLNVTGTVSGVDRSGSGVGYAIRSGREDMAGGWDGDDNVDDIVALGDGASITGHIDLGGGTNALTMNGAGSMTGDLRSITTIDKTGAGIWTVRGHTDVTTLDVTAGTMRMYSGEASSPTNTASGALTVGPASTLEVGFYQSAAPSLTVAGAGTVNGTVVFVPKGTVAPGTFTVMTMGSTAGAGQYTAPALLFTVDTSVANTVRLTKTGYSSIRGLSPNAQTMADVLTPLSATATGDLNTVLTALDGVMSIDELETCLEQLTPVVEASMVGQSFAVGDMFAGAVDMHLAEARSGFTALAGLDTNDPDSWPLLADNGELATLGGLSFGQDKQTAAYLRVLGQSGGMSDQGTYYGYESQTYGLTGGLDRLLRDGLIFGVNLGYANTQMQFNDEGSESEVDSWTLGTYATLFEDDWYVDMTLSAGLNRYDVDRAIRFLGRTATSEYYGYLLSAAASGGYDVPLAGLVLTPQWSLGYSGLYQEQYTETGAGASNLTVDEQMHHSLESGLGARVSLPLETSMGMFVPEVSVLWSHDYLTRDLSMDTQIAGNSGTTYEMLGAESDRDALRLGAGATIRTNDGSQFSLQYQGEFREHSWSHAGVLEYRVMF